MGHKITNNYEPVIYWFNKNITSCFNHNFMNEVAIPATLIKRNQYISRIVPFMDKQLIKTFTGQRLVGKSYILLQLIQLIKNKNPDAPVIYINKEDLLFDAIRTAGDLSSYVLSRVVANQMNYAFIDEIQEISEFEKALRSLLLNENIDIYCTGSNAKLLSGELATLLSGRFVEITIYSLSFAEFLPFHHLKDSDNSLN